MRGRISRFVGIPTISGVIQTEACGGELEALGREDDPTYLYDHRWADLANTSNEIINDLKKT
ncbi:hypothetical protein GW916_05455 [bacterium]|nr:hypothetical protein [bacterium]